MQRHKRSKNNIQDPYTLPDMYEDYIKDIEEDSPYYVSYSEYVGIVTSYYKSLMDDILEKGKVFKLPYGMGTVSVTKKLLKKFDSLHLPIDWALTKQLGKRVYHINDHTNNYKFRFRWSKKLVHTKNIHKYRLVFTRTNKRRLASLIKDGGYDYIED